MEKQPKVGNQLERKASQEMSDSDKQIEDSKTIRNTNLLNDNFDEIEFSTIVDGRVDSYEVNFRELAGIPKRTDRLTHLIHKHPAVFIPHIPNYIIDHYTLEPDLGDNRPIILDPFNGSGTAGVEAKVLGRDYLGIEVNPLSKLVSNVATTPIPPTLLRRTRRLIGEELNQLAADYYSAHDPDFPGKTKKSHWFEQPAIEGLTRLRTAILRLIDAKFTVRSGLVPQETAAVQRRSDDELRMQIKRLLILMVGNTAYKVSNADPGISKAYKSKNMKELIEQTKHPPDVETTFFAQLDDSIKRLMALWDKIYGTEFVNGGFSTGSDNNHSIRAHTHQAKTQIELEDARSFAFPEYKGNVDLAITSPPYINAINYYRGTKLRLFWIYDLIDALSDLDKFRRSFVGTDSVELSRVDRKLPATMAQEWQSSKAEFEATSLPELDADIRAIHLGEHSEPHRQAYVTWKFFAKDMLQSIARTYEHLKRGGYFFVLIGANTVGGRQIESHRYLIDIARHVGKFKQHGGDLSDNDGFVLRGLTWDRIKHRDLFIGRDHGQGSIEKEWVIALQKPR